MCVSSVKIPVVWDVNAFEASVLLVGREDEGSTLAGKARAYRSIRCYSKRVPVFFAKLGTRQLPNDANLVHAVRAGLLQFSNACRWLSGQEVRSVVMFKGHVPFLLEFGGNTILRNIGCHSPSDTMSGLRRPESPQRLHLNLAVC